MADTTGLERAAFVISIDVEMAWGANHRPGLPYRYPEERVHLRRVVDLFDRFEIPATWAIVGHLMLDRCEPLDGLSHPEILRPSYEWLDGDWFDRDPCTDVHQAPTWYAPDVVELILAGAAPHEVASHGFSHMIAGDPGCSREAFDSEVQAAQAAAAERGLTLRSMVHPRNRIGHVDVLRARGFVAYRGRTPSVAPVGRARRLADRFAGSERTLVRPVDEDGIWNLPASTMFDIDARPRTWQIWIRQVQRRLSQAVAHRSLFHLWFHPHNLRDRPEESFAALTRICRAADAHRSAGRLDTLTMGQLADRLGEQTP